MISFISSSFFDVCLNSVWILSSSMSFFCKNKFETFWKFENNSANLNFRHETFNFLRKIVLWRGPNFAGCICEIRCWLLDDVMNELWPFQTIHRPSAMIFHRLVPLQCAVISLPPHRHLCSLYIRLIKTWKCHFFLIFQFFIFTEFVFYRVGKKSRGGFLGLRMGLKLMNRFLFFVPFISRKRGRKKQKTQFFLTLFT